MSRPAVQEITAGELRRALGSVPDDARVVFSNVPGNFGQRIEYELCEAWPDWDANEYHITLEPRQ